MSCEHQPAVRTAATALVLACLCIACSHDTFAARVTDVNDRFVCLRAAGATKTVCMTAGDDRTFELAGKPLTWYETGTCISIDSVSEGGYGRTDDVTPCPPELGEPPSPPPPGSTDRR
jgi:hypothetical protein